jgi:hypothetical protein
MKQNVYNKLRKMPCEKKGYTTNDYNTSLHVITNGNSFLELKILLKDDQFAYKFT